MTALHQIQMQYDAYQDRGLLRISTRDGSEFRFWLTRRYVLVLWPVLRRLLESNDQVQAQQRSEDRETVLAFQHQSALQGADFGSRYQETASSTPLGAQPLLLAKVRVDDGSQGARILCLLPREGQGVQLAMDDRLAHSFASLLQRTAVAAGWDLDLTLDTVVVKPAPAERRLN